jgi:uncharacterized protein
VIAYFDTSAIIRVLISEPGSDRARSLWERADRVASVRLVYPEGRAALARARHLGRLTSRQLRDAVRRLDARLDELDVIELDEDLAHRAGELAEEHGLRGYDAVHLAAAALLRSPDLIVVAGDIALLDAAQQHDLAVAAVV